MSKSMMGARVIYCGHKATFIADIFLVGNVNVVKANGPIRLNELDWDSGFTDATHRLTDFPQTGVWMPERGVFVVPEKQVTELKDERL